MTLKRSPLFVLPVVVAATAASAADISPVVVPPIAVPVVVPGPVTLVQVEGGPVFSPSGITEATTFPGDDEPYDKFGTISNDRGFYLGAAVRRMFPSNVGVQAAITGTWLRSYNEGQDAELLSTMRFQTLDVDVGLHPGGDIRTRFFAGIRALHAVDALTLTSHGVSLTEATSTGTAWMIGPRAGANVDMPLGASHFSLVGDFAAAALFGHADVFLERQFTGNLDASGFRMAFNVEAQAGLAWHPSETFALTFGYRAQQWWGIRQATEVETDDGFFTGFVSVSPNKLIHGPFGRISLTF